MEGIKGERLVGDEVKWREGEECPDEEGRRL